MRRHHRARRAEKIDRSDICRVLRLRLLAPELVEGFVDGRQSEGMTWPALMRQFRYGGKSNQSNSCRHGS